ncbi:fimbria/pilus outer membrane usher protein [Vibrio galatheae]|uniref:fimbria/pilus outer membrane usher protein n=1 Tax=Vibrio galatheae TaxID=579748 RepID=UPI000A019382|nr:fimbria/pilus outer membrane usher protein [Vibrio galatheae]
MNIRNINILYNRKGIQVLSFSKVKSLAVCVILALYGQTSYATAEDVEFDPAFLKLSNNNSVDLSRFSAGANALPGTYPSSVFVNNQLIKTANVTIKSDESNATWPCITKNIIKNISFDYTRLSAQFTASLSDVEECIDVAGLIPGSSVSYDSNESRLDIQIPQLYMKREARGSVSPELWSDGVPAFMVNYNVNTYSSHSYGEDYQSTFASISTGVNIDDWYFRQSGTISWADSGVPEYSGTNAYIQRDITPWQGRVTIGQTNTSGKLFDTLPFTGVTFNTDERMLPDSQRGYAPEIHGIAKTTARVTVKQNDRVIYETTVSPGEFLIDDLYPTGFGGNLEVSVLESDGSEQHFLVPYSSMAQLLRPGSHSFSATVGEYRDSNLQEAPMFFEGSYQRGLTNSLTGYAGIQANQDYYALQAGTAIGTPIGAFSVDVTHARTVLPSGLDAEVGQSYQFRFSKNITETGSDLSLAAYRFSTDGYMDFQTAMRTRDQILLGNDASNVNRAKSRFVLTASQRLPRGWGQFYISSSAENYWQESGRFEQYQAGYNNRYQALTWGVSVNRSEDAHGVAQNNFQLTFSMPLGQADSGTVPQLRATLNRDTQGTERQQVNISDTIGDSNQFSYGVTVNNSNRSATSGDVNLGYLTPVSNLNMNYSVGEDYQSTSVRASGSVIVHSGGLTMSPYTGNTFALVKAEGAEGARVSGYSGIQIDSNNYAIVPYLNPYQMNEISIDPSMMSNKVELLNTSDKVSPKAGAVVLIEYETNKGTPILIDSMVQGVPVPFGATVFDSEGQMVGSVGQGGQIYARVSTTTGRLKVSWGQTEAEQCQLNYALTGKEQAAIPRFTTECNL